MGIITLNLPKNWSSTLIKVGLCLALAFTSPITVHPIHEMLETKLKSREWFQFRSKDKSSGGNDWLSLQVARVLIVVALAVLTTLVPAFSVLISLSGSTICGLISFVLLTSIHLKFMGSAPSLWQRLLDYIILTFGVVFAVYGTTSATSAGHFTDP